MSQGYSRAKLAEYRIAFLRKEWLREPAYAKLQEKIDLQQYVSASTARAAIARSKVSPRKKAKLRKRIDELARDTDVLRVAFNARMKGLPSTLVVGHSSYSYRECQKQFRAKHGERALLGAGRVFYRAIGLIHPDDEEQSRLINYGGDS